MKTGTAVAAAALALVTTVAGARAQAPDLLNALEIHRLVASGEPADHAGLRDHFLALAVRYDAEARRQEALSRAAAGNPNRRWAIAPGAHATRLAAEARQSAHTVRALAVYHEQIAAGVPATAPTNSGAFYSTLGTAAPTYAEARALTATARQPADHRAMEEYFATIALQHRETADRYVTLARHYRALSWRTGGGDPAIHCDRIVRLSREAAARADARALVHRQLATLPGYPPTPLAP